MSLEYHKDKFTISTDPAKLDLDVIYGYLSRSYWAAGRPRATVEKSIKHSLCFGVYDESKQVGFARVITDFATFAYLADVFILEEYRGHGLGKWLVSVIMGHSDLQGLRRWSLATRDAHELYRQYGFTELKTPDRWMEIFRPTNPNN
jgi:GNAT superfamily N-acetyltransferase